MAPTHQPLVKYEGKIPLNPAELAVVKAWKRLENPNQSRVAKALNLTRATVSHHCTKSNVADAITLAEQRKADKAQGIVRTLQSIGNKATRLLDRNLERPTCASCGYAEISIMELGSAVKLCIDGQRAAEDAGFGHGDVDAQRYRDRVKRILARAARIGASGRWPLGYRPQDVVVGAVEAKVKG